MKKVGVGRGEFGLFQQVEDVYSLNDMPVDSTPVKTASTRLAKELLRLAEVDKSRIKQDSVINFKEYNTTGFEQTGDYYSGVGEELLNQGGNAIRKSLDVVHEENNSLFHCDCGEAYRYRFVDNKPGLRAVCLECAKCGVKYWFIPQYVYDEIVKFEKTYADSAIDVETKVVWENYIMDKISRLPVGGNYIIFEERRK